MNNSLCQVNGIHYIGYSLVRFGESSILTTDDLRQNLPEIKGAKVVFFPYMSELIKYTLTSYAQNSITCVQNNCLVYYIIFVE